MARKPACLRCMRKCFRGKLPVVCARLLFGTLALALFLVWGGLQLYIHFAFHLPKPGVPAATLPPSASTYDPLVLDREEQRLRDMKDMIEPLTFAIKPAKSTSEEIGFQYRDLAATQAQRLERIRQVCHVKKAQNMAKYQKEAGATLRRDLGADTLYHEGWYDNTYLDATLKVYRPQNILFCPVLKVGSTFFTRLFFAIAKELHISSPYDVTIRESRKLDKYLWREEFAHNVTDAAKMMFTREPFSKLLSGYVDKLWSPNPYFWSTVGKYIVRRFRPGASIISLNCGHDVTFPEFIQYVLESERHNTSARDAHFVPSYDQCKPCDISYDLVGTMETFSRDVSLLLAQLGINISQSTLRNWSREADQDAIDDSIRSLHDWSRLITMCMPFREAEERVWRKLQIQGFLDRNEALPSTPKELSEPEDEFNFLAFASRLTSRTNDYGNLVSAARQRLRSKSPGDHKWDQKKEALSAAYSLVPREHLQQLREFFLLDFDLFGYDSRPVNVFKANSTWDVFVISSRVR